MNEEQQALLKIHELDRELFNRMARIDSRTHLPYLREGSGIRWDIHNRQFVGLNHSTGFHNARRANNLVAQPFVRPQRTNELEPLEQLEELPNDIVPNEAAPVNSRIINHGEGTPIDVTRTVHEVPGGEPVTRRVIQQPGARGSGQPGSPNNPHGHNQQRQSSIDPVQQALWRRRTEALQRMRLEQGISGRGYVGDFVNHSTHRAGGRQWAYDRRTNQWVEIPRDPTVSNRDWRQATTNDLERRRDTQARQRHAWNIANPEGDDEAFAAWQESRQANQDVLNRARQDDRHIFGPGRSIFGFEPGESRTRYIMGSLGRPILQR
jgi:hypothetical protein